MKFKSLHLKNLILVAIFALMSGSAWAYDFQKRYAQEIDEVTYFYDMWFNILPNVDHQVEVTFKDTNYNSYYESTRIAIPETVTYNDVTYTVTAIGANAFRNCTILQYIYLSDVTSIGDNAFYGCTGLVNLTLTTKILTIGSNAFDGCTGLPSVTIPAQMTSIGQAAFNGCTNLANIYYNATDCTMGSYIFQDCTHDCTLHIGNDVPGIPTCAFYSFPGLKTINFGTHANFYIRASAFYACTGLTSLVIPDNVTTIDRFAFDGCTGLTEVTIGAGVVSIGDTWGQTFNNCRSITTINYNATNCPDLDITYSLWQGCTHACTVHIGDNVTRLPKGIFKGLTNLNTIVYGSNPSLTEIGGWAFENTGLISVTIPNTVTTIGGSAFSGCTALASLDLGSVRIINSNAFAHCTSLKKLIIPVSVDEIHESGGANGAFWDCRNLQEIWFMGATRPTIDSYVFDGVPTDIPVYVPKGYYNICSFTNYKYFLRFVGGNSYNNWTVASNWAGATGYTNTAAPENDEIAIIDGENDPFVPDEYVAQPYKIILGDGRKIIINDGGQLLYDEAVQVTAQKEISTATQYWNTASDGWYFIASPIATNIVPSAENYMLTPDDATYITEMNPDGHSFDLYAYDEQNGIGEGDPKPWVNYRAHVDNFVISNGHGYLYASAYDPIIEFTGVTKPYSTEDNANKVFFDYTGWHLVGNPYTFAVTVDRDFASLHNASAVTNERHDNAVIMPCEGIAVYGEIEEYITFTKYVPESPVTSQNHGLNMLLTNANVRDAKPIDNAIVSFGEGNGMPKFEFGEQNAKLYIPQNGKDYAIVYSDGQGELPLNFEASENGTYTITFNAENAEMNYLHLIDNLTGADIDLLATPSYSFEAKTTDYASRFSLVFNANNEDGALTGSETFSYYNGSEWVIANTGEATLQVLDMTGRLLSSETINGNATININQPAGVYVMRLMNGEHVKVQKVVVR